MGFTRTLKKGASRLTRPLESIAGSKMKCNTVPDLTQARSSDELIEYSCLA